MAVKVKVVKKTKEGVEIIPLNVGIKMAPKFHTWESFNKAFKPTSDKFIYEMSEELDKQGKEMAQWFEKHYAMIKMALHAGGQLHQGLGDPSSNLAHMGVLGGLAEEFCTTFEASMADFLETFQMFEKAMLMQMNQQFGESRRFKSDRPNPSNTPKPAPKEPTGATIGDMLKAKGKALA
jgi:hypothetical protein